jgi:L-alanine-DL-glutamate epimerase-like enolase superfamily enzyme
MAYQVIPTAYTRATTPAAASFRAPAQRQGWWIQIKNGGDFGWAECCTWPGFGDQAGLERAIWNLPPECSAPDPYWPVELLSAWNNALLDLDSRRQSIPLCKIFSGPVSESVSSAIMVHTEEEALLAFAAGARTLKVKLRPDNVSDVISLANLIHNTDEDASIRIDANQSLELAAAEKLVRSLPKSEKIWLEEPLNLPLVEDKAALEQVLKFRDLCHSKEIRLIADESTIHYRGWRVLIESRWADSVSIKPMFVGGLSAARERALESMRLGIMPYFSHAMESVLGRQQVAHLAASLQRPICDGLSIGESVADCRIHLDLNRPGTGVRLTTGPDGPEWA